MSNIGESLGAFRNPVAAALFIAPTLCVLTVRFINPAQGPAAASGQESSPSAVVIVDTKASARTPQGAALLEAQAQAASQAFGTSPLSIPELVAPQIDPLTIATPNPQPTPKAPEAGPPKITLTAIMTRGRQPFAVVNGKLRKVGDEIVVGWVLDSIDGKLGMVVVKGPEDKSVSALINPKSGKGE